MISNVGRNIIALQPLLNGYGPDADEDKIISYLAPWMNFNDPSEVRILLRHWRIFLAFNDDFSIEGWYPYPESLEEGERDGEEASPEMIQDMFTDLKGVFTASIDWFVKEYFE